MKTEGLDKAFNTSFEKGEEESSPVLSHNLITLPSEESQISEDSPKISLENKEFARKEIKDLITTCQEVLYEQKQYLDEDAKASSVMAFADLVRTTTDLIKELNLMDKNENELNIKMKNSKTFAKQPGILPVSGDNPSITISLTGSDMVRRILEFNKNSELTAIDTSFKLEEDITDES